MRSLWIDVGAPSRFLAWPLQARALVLPGRLNEVKVAKDLCVGVTQSKERKSSSLAWQPLDDECSGKFPAFRASGTVGSSPLHRSVSDLPSKTVLQEAGGPLSHFQHVQGLGCVTNAET